MSQVIGLPNNSYKPITNTAWVRTRLCKLLKGCTRLTAASDKYYQLLAHGRWFSPGTSTTKTGRHDIAEILLKVALNTINKIKIISFPIYYYIIYYVHTLCGRHVIVVLLMYIYWYIIKTNGVKYTLFFISRPYTNTRNPYHI